LTNHGIATGSTNSPSISFYKFTVMMYGDAKKSKQKLVYVEFGAS